MQTAEQVKVIADGWKHPAGLIASYENGETIRKAISEHFAGIWSHANLDAVIERLGDRLQYNVKIVERTPTQTQEQVDAIFREWTRKCLPKHLLLNAENIAILNAYVKMYFAGVYSLTSLSEAANNAEGLKYETATEIAKRGEQKMRRDYQDSLNAHKPDEARAPKKKVLDDAEAIAKVNSKIVTTINGYACNNKLGIDYALTEERRNEMRKIAAGFGNTLKEREAALKTVLQKFMSYPS
jgi:hypothetical protein